MHMLAYLISYSIWFNIIFSKQNTTDILLPRDPMPMLEHRECMVEPGCSYDVFVETTDRKIQQTTQYTVPGKWIYLFFFPFCMQYEIILLKFFELQIA